MTHLWQLFKNTGIRTRFTFVSAPTNSEHSILAYDRRCDKYPRFKAISEYYIAMKSMYFDLRVYALLTVIGLLISHSGWSLIGLSASYNGERFLQLCEQLSFIAGQAETGAIFPCVFPFMITKCLASRQLRIAPVCNWSSLMDFRLPPRIASCSYIELCIFLMIHDFMLKHHLLLPDQYILSDYRICKVKCQHALVVTQHTWSNLLTSCFLTVIRSLCRL